MNYSARVTIIATFLISVSCASSVFAQTPSSIRINEFAVEPEQTIELVNTSQSLINISGWHLDDSGGQTFYTIPENSFIYPNSCMVIIKNISLNKSSTDQVRLFDSTTSPIDSGANLVDSYEYPQSPGPGKSFVRNPDGEDMWEIRDSSFGVYNASGVSCEVIPTPTFTPTSTPTSTSTPTPSPTPTPTESVSISYDNIFINEIMGAPDTGQSEWVELFNANDFSVSLTNWYIDDVADGGSSPKKFSTTIPSGGLVAIEMSSSIFNNSGDDVRLLDGDMHEKGIFTYESSQKGTSWGTVEKKSKDFCLQNPTKNADNSACLAEESDEVSTSQSPSKSTKSTSSRASSSLSSQMPASSRPPALARYAIQVTPPTILLTKSGDNAGDVLSATAFSPHDSPKITVFPLLAASYSLLSIVSLVAKMLYT